MSSVSRTFAGTTPNRFVLNVPVSRCRYSIFHDQLRLIAASRPAPALEPASVFSVGRNRIGAPIPWDRSAESQMPRQPNSYRLIGAPTEPVIDPELDHIDVAAQGEPVVDQRTVRRKVVQLDEIVFELRRPVVRKRPFDASSGRPAAGRV